MSAKNIVSKITVARLFNLGNYEHERIEVTVESEDFPEIKSPEIVLAELRNVLKCCEPIMAGYSENTGRAIEEGKVFVWDGSGNPPEGTWVGADVAAEYIDAWKKYQIAESKRLAGFLRLRELGQVTVTGGAQ